MSDNKDELIKMLIEQIKNNSDKLDEMKHSYYELKSMTRAHQIVDEKMHEDICGFIQSTNTRLDEYNRQLQIHIAGTIQNREDIAEFKKTMKPIMDDFVEERALKKAREKKIKNIKNILALIATAGGIIAGVLKYFQFI